MNILPLLIATAALEQAPDTADLHSPSRQPLSAEELNRLRGGFAWDGVTIELGAEIRSYMDDALVMQTNVSWSSSGVETTRFIADALTPATAHAMRNNLVAGSTVRFTAPQGTVFFANDGRTAFAHRTEGALQNVVLNTAGNAALRQEMDIQINLGNAAAFQNSARVERIGTSLVDLLNQPLLGGK